MSKSTLFGASDPLPGDGTILLPGSDGMFPGTFWSWQPGHEVYGIKGDTVDGSFVPENAAWRNLADMAGCTEAEARYGKTVEGSDNGPTKMKIEETDSGVHFIVSQSVDTTNTRIMICAPDAAKQWLLDHSFAGAGVTATDGTNVANQAGCHRIGSKLKFKPTRMYRTDGSKVGNTAIIAGIGNPAGGTNTMGVIQGSMNTVNYPISAVENTGYALTAPATTTINDIGSMFYPAGAPVLDTPQLRWCGARAWHSAKPATIADFEIGVGAGHLFGQTQSGFIAACMSYVLWEYSLTDLSIATGYGDFQGFGNRGSIDRTFDFGDPFQVRNVIMAAFNRSIAAGGEHFGDPVPTAPSTIA